MAGIGFPGMPLGSFSGRGADFSPFQNIMAMRQEALAREQAKRQQEAALKQNFVLALMAKKQQEAELAQRASEAQASQQQRQAESAAQAEQFKAEQSRIQQAQQAQMELQRIAQDRLEQQERRLQARQDEDLARNKLEGATAENRRALAMKVHGATSAGLEKRYAAMTSNGGLIDPLTALDTVERHALDDAKELEDPEAAALAVDEIRAWRAQKEQRLLGRESLQSVIEDREQRRDLRGREVAAREGAVQESAAVRRIKAKQSVIQGEGGLLDRAEAQLAVARTPEERAAAQKKIDNLEAELRELADRLAAEE